MISLLLLVIEFMIKYNGYSGIEEYKSKLNLIVLK